MPKCGVRARLLYQFARLLDFADRPALRRATSRNQSYALQVGQKSGRIAVNLCYDGARTDRDVPACAKTTGVLRRLFGKQSQAGNALRSPTNNVGAVEDAFLRAHDGEMFSVCDNQQIRDPVNWNLNGT